jgi:peptide/nickel transport system permease protein
MGGYLPRRALQSCLLLLVLSFVAFALLHLAPGDPAALLYGPDATASDLAQVRARWGLDRPLPAQYLSWLGHTLRGDLGRSLADGRPVTRVIGERLPATLLLALPALLGALIVGVGLGMVAAVRAGSPLDRAMTLLATLGYSTPSFWLALLLVLLFSLTWRWLPSGGLSAAGGDAAPLDVVAHLLLPATVLALPFVAQFQRFSRAAMVEVLGQGYVRTARAKGLGRPAVLLGHALRNAAVPILTLLALALPQLLSGAVVVETVFAWPGLGRLLVESAFQRNYSVLMGDILLVGGLVVAANLLVDLAYPLVDPRIRPGGR